MASVRAQSSKHNGVAHIAFENPPVNALGASTIVAILEQLTAAEADATVTAVVLSGTNGTFCAGADISAFAAPDPSAITTRDLIARLEGARFPVVAALEGNVLGAGLEIALGCDYRLAAPNTRLGLPEIKLGLVPGAEGTQRLPRLIGVAAAVDMIVSGEPVAADRALALGLVDGLTSGALWADAIAFAGALPADGKRRTSALTAGGDAEPINAARSRVEPAERGGLAARYALDCIADALTLPFTDGSRRERERFAELRASEQSRARVHLFFAQREAAKPPATLGSEPFRARTAVVIGSGTMGSGIAMALANAGIRVTLLDVEAAQIARARTIIEGNYAATVRKGRLTQAQLEERLAAIAYATDLRTAADVDLVIEAVYENLDVKRELFAQLDGIARPGTLLATNTSTLDIDAIAHATTRPDEVIGLHFFSPANIMKLLEIVRGAQTSPQTIANALNLSKQIGKIGVVAGNCDGFIGNRMLYPYRREAEFLLEEGATPQQIDAAIKAFGFAMGPFAMSDLAGLDIGWSIRKRRHAEHPPVGRYSRIADMLCEMGRFGQKTGAGYYRYEAGSRVPIADPIIDDVVERAARENGITRRAISAAEIVKRCIYPLINEAAAILAEGIASRPGDIDVVWVNGYGFPAFRGGPLRYADAIGLPSVIDDMVAYEKTHGSVWAPAPLLRELARSGDSFGAWSGEHAWATR